MGFESNTSRTVYIYDNETGERVGDLSDLATIGEVDESYGGYPKLNVNDAWSFELRPARMSRRRFVKKLMGMGISRNAANTYAKICAKHKKPYGQQYWAIVFADLLK